MHLQKAGILDKFNDNTNNDPKLGYLHCLLPSIVAFYENGKKPQVDQRFSDSAKATFDEACWVTMAIGDTLVFTGVEDDVKTTKVNWKNRVNWMTKQDVFAALLEHPMAKPHRHKEWDTVWKDVKVKNRRLRGAYDKNKCIESKKGHFFGVRRAPPLAEVLPSSLVPVNFIEETSTVEPFSGQGNSIGSSTD